MYVVPSGDIVRWFSRFKSLKRWRFHPLVTELEAYRNNWQPLHRVLATPTVTGQNAADAV